jgi:hypothetical protein
MDVLQSLFTVLRSYFIAKQSFMKNYIRLVRSLLWLCAALLFIFYVLAWSGALPADGFMQMRAKGLDAAAMRALTLQARWTGALLDLPQLLAMAYGFWRLAQLLRDIEQGRLFARATIGHLRSFAGATLLATVFSILAVPLRTLALDGRFSIGVSSDELLLMLVCGLFFLVTHLLHEGRRLAEENEGFV